MLGDVLGQYLDACFSGVYVQSAEHEDAISEVSALCRCRQWQLAVWDMAGGLQMNGQSNPDMKDPLAVLASLPAMAPNGEGSAVMLLRNFHAFMDNPEIVAEMCRQIEAGKVRRTFIVVLSPVVKIPVELEKHFVVLEHELPGRTELEAVARGIATREGEMPEGSDLDKLLDASAGLTRMEAEGAFSLSLVRDGKLHPESVWELKSGMLKKTGCLSLYHGTESFSELGGLDNLKAFTFRAITRSKEKVRPKGVMLLGVYGTGKSAFAKALGAEVGRPTLVLTSEQIKTSAYGKSEELMAKSLKIADMMAPCILFVDEIEGLLAGVNKAGDPGVSKSIGKVFSIWLTDHTSDVFVVATSNDISDLPGEFTRAGRFDAVFFVDTPGRDQRDMIWKIHEKKYGIEPQDRPDDTNWTGAEIESACRLSALLDVPLVAAADNVVPVVVTQAEKIEAMRQFAAGRCLNAEATGRYQRAGHPVARRNIERGPTTQPSTN